MCLYSTLKTPIVAEKPIITYKCIEVLDKQHWVGPFFDNIVFEFDKKITNTEITHEPMLHWTYDLQQPYVYEIGKGYFHTYQNKAKALKTLEYFECAYPDRTYAVCECIIPKGSEFYESYDSKPKSYASKQIKISSKFIMKQ